MAKTIAVMPRLRGYDVVQFINPMFLELKAQRLFSIFDYLKKHNGKIVLGAFGMDYYWVNENRTRKPFRYGDFNASHIYVARIVFPEVSVRHNSHLMPQHT